MVGDGYVVCIFFIWCVWLGFSSCIIEFVGNVCCRVCFLGFGGVLWKFFLKFMVSLYGRWCLLYVVIFYLLIVG